MIDLYQTLLRPLLFSLDAEQAHHLALRMASFANHPIFSRPLFKFCDVGDPRLAVTVAGLQFANPIGLAAGLDKEGLALPALAALGFGAIEVGTVTAEAQIGNPRPRIFRLPADKALINRMGFPSAGADHLARRLSEFLPLASHLKAKVGINIGKTKRIDIDSAANDYLRSFEILRSFGDYFVINISSPNTPELRKLQEPDRLCRLLNAIQSVGIEGRPLFVKISPDLDDSQLAEVIDVVVSNRGDGIIATNTTFAREGLKTAIDEVGGLSGQPLKSRALHVVAKIFHQTKGTLPIIGVGGVSSADDVWRMMEAGASAVQVYTGFVYRGPLMVNGILAELIKKLSDENVKSIQNIIGRQNNAILQG